MSMLAAKRLLLETIRPVHDGLKAEFGIPNPPEAEIMSVAAAYQESKCSARDQGDPNVIGPATGFWQFEKNGGVAEILEHPMTDDIARALAVRSGIAATRDSVWRFFTSEQGDELACVFARLLVWKDRAALPAATPAAASEAYAYYDRNWRPGAKRPNDWPTSWNIALQVVRENPRPADSSPVISPPVPPGVFVSGAMPPVTSEIEALRARIAEIERRLSGARITI